MPFTPNSPEQYWMRFIASSAFKINRRIALKSGGALLWNLGDGQSLDGSSVLLYRFETLDKVLEIGKVHTAVRVSRACTSVSYRANKLRKTATRTVGMKI